ncbi:hypothetical protein OCU04_001958 [Sclerotinia nivalis]|uniref:Uncharacterized protein n=1 Tax=Sclerotinia nivalis TaxID=352851 RepID=A0A9X0B0W7_9HELO|nr:hypothetical protein OCU04_001958 [Sclerotinia nivalis]
MKNKGLTIIPYNLFRKYKEEEIRMISNRFDNEPPRHYDTTTLEIVFDIPNQIHQTRQSIKTPSIPIKKIFAKSIEIESNNDSLPKTLQRKIKTKTTIKDESILPI